jgi:hypothetical protein
VTKAAPDMRHSSAEAVSWEAAMTWGIPTEAFVQIHVVISLIAIASGLIVLYRLLKGKLLGGWTALFLAATILTSGDRLSHPAIRLGPGIAHNLRQIALGLLAGIYPTVIQRCR